MTKIGSKVQVWRGIAEKTSSGLRKNDIIRKKIDGKWRYRSRKQLGKRKGQKSRIRWTKALGKARALLKKEYPESRGKLVLVLKPYKKYSSLRLSKKEKTWGNFLYRKAKELYTLA
jgi:hypothetical protein